MYTSYLSSNRLRGTWTVIPAENNTSFSPVKPSVRTHHREQALRIHDIISLPGKVVHSVFPTALHCSKVLQCDVNKKWKIRWCRSTACVNLVSALRGISCKQGDPIWAKAIECFLFTLIAMISAALHAWHSWFICWAAAIVRLMEISRLGLLRREKGQGDSTE